MIKMHEYCDGEIIFQHKKGAAVENRSECLLCFARPHLGEPFAKGCVRFFGVVYACDGLFHRADVVALSVDDLVGKLAVGAGDTVFTQKRERGFGHYAAVNSRKSCFDKQHCRRLADDNVCGGKAGDGLARRDQLHHRGDAFAVVKDDLVTAA